GGLLIPETRVIADSYLRLGDWDVVREEVVGQNLLHKPRQESARRYIREIRERVKSAYEWEVPVMAGHDGGPDQARLVVLAATVRYYRLVWEFLVEEIRYKITGGDFKLLGFEFESFWERKAESAAEMREVTETSRKKLIQVAYRMLQEAGYLPGGRDGAIVAPTVPYGLTTRYAAERDSDTLLAFLLPDHEIRRLIAEGAS
ncbi:MAG: DUF1819 family protein, partial [Spirochaetaceae bacterium]|nr:DUF1819 family protein [Spirochaetaceae bacterium]